MKEQFFLLSSHSGGCCLTSRSVWGRAASSAWVQGLGAARAVPLSWVNQGTSGLLKNPFHSHYQQDCVVTRCFGVVEGWVRGGRRA